MSVVGVRKGSFIDDDRNEVTTAAAAIATEYAVTDSRSGQTSLRVPLNEVWHIMGIQCYLASAIGVDLAIRMYVDDILQREVFLRDTNPLHGKSEGVFKTTVVVPSGSTLLMKAIQYSGTADNTARTFTLKTRRIGV